ncbi:hypothetical protein SporoP8_08490 [Sporosarcina ureae]|uniref:hypothetical protein n=1 Tax=Sporosarcina TaxID=1569 RepID=UPI000A14D85D|nr:MULTISPECIES: hypothetical protein [Sporosarcina]ARJ38904.1 hypothetical protein SporoP8_08490 [Sporosarcina ureae]PIC84082.1 hypothetical protein CSV73_03675 [Sporosarcina sp. P1]
MMMTSFFGLINLILFLIIPVALIYVLFKYFKRAEKRADEKLQLEKQNTINLQKRIDELNERLIAIEKMLKEVE